VSLSIGIGRDSEPILGENKSICVMLTHMKLAIAYKL